MRSKIKDIDISNTIKNWNEVCHNQKPIEKNLPRANKDNNQLYVNVRWEIVCNDFAKCNLRIDVITAQLRKRVSFWIAYRLWLRQETVASEIVQTPSEKSCWQKRSVLLLTLHQRNEKHRTPAYQTGSRIAQWNTHSCEPEKLLLLTNPPCVNK